MYNFAYPSRVSLSNFFNVDIKTGSDLDIFQLVLFKDEHFDQRGWVNDSIAGDLMLFANILNAVMFHFLLVVVSEMWKI